MSDSKVTQLRSSLIQEARQSPTLLADLAGLERYIAESYSRRSFVELLQNADDAGARRFCVSSYDGLLAVANDGRVFNIEDLESLCRSAASTKRRGTSIGYRGIGFKSVVGIADAVYLFSGGFGVQFSRSLTKSVLGVKSEVPLVRIPHEIDADNNARVQAIVRRSLDDGYTSVFLFDSKVNASIESEYAELDASSLLFLRSVQEIILTTPTNNSRHVINRSPIGEQRATFEIDHQGATARWNLHESAHIAIASMADATLEGFDRKFQDQFVVHAFLPTHERTGFRFKVNGDFSTDPSRTRVVDDAITSRLISETADLYLQVLRDVVFNGTDASDVYSLVPFEDLRNAKFSRPGFYTRLVDCIRTQAGSAFSDVLLRPEWINGQSYERLARKLTIGRTLPSEFEQIDGLRELLLFLGAREVKLDALTEAARYSSVGELGAIELISAIVRDLNTRGVSPTQNVTQSKIWKSKGELMSLDDAVKSGAPFDDDFIELLIERGASRAPLRRLVAGFTAPERAARLIPEHRQQIPPRENENKLTKLPEISTTRWRSAERQVAEVLEQKGWDVEDVSRQNLGYDLKARHSEHGMKLIEVKSVPRVGAEFSLTTNEEGVARSEGANYLVALVGDSLDGIEIGFIQDPTRNAIMERQCRQWAWICDSYQCQMEYVPFK